MNLGLDIDGTISAAPAFFRRVARAWRAAGREVHVISARSDDPQVRRITEEDLAAWGIPHQGLHLLPGIAASQTLCPHGHLDWYSRYLWQKVAIAQALDVTVYFDDDAKVLSLFSEFAPAIRACPVEPAVTGGREAARELARVLAMLEAL